MIKPLARLLLCALVLGASPTTRACGYDMAWDNPFQLSWPGSLDIAMATSAAISTDRLSPIPAIMGKEGFSRSYQWLNQLRASLKTTGIPGNVSILLVDSGLWSRLRGKQTLLLQSHTQGPVEGDRVVLLSEAAIDALLAGRLSASAAVALGVMRIDEDAGGVLLQRLDQALAREIARR